MAMAMAMAVAHPARRDLATPPLLILSHRVVVADLSTTSPIIRRQRAIVADLATTSPIIRRHRALVADLASPGILRHRALLTSPPPCFLNNSGGRSLFSPPPLGAAFSSNGSHLVVGLPLLGAGAGSGRRGRVLARCSSKNTEEGSNDEAPAFFSVLIVLVGIASLTYVGDSKTAAEILDSIRTSTRTVVFRSIIQLLVRMVQKLAGAWERKMVEQLVNMMQQLPRGSKGKED